MVSVQLDLSKYYIFAGISGGLIVVYGIAVIFNLRPIQMATSLNGGFGTMKNMKAMKRK